MKINKKIWMIGILVFVFVILFSQFILSYESNDPDYPFSGTINYYVDDDNLGADLLRGTGWDHVNEDELFWYDADHTKEAKVDALADDICNSSASNEGYGDYGDRCSADWWSTQRGICINYQSYTDGYCKYYAGDGDIIVDKDGYFDSSTTWYSLRSSVPNSWNGSFCVDYYYNRAYGFCADGSNQSGSCVVGVCPDSDWQQTDEEYCRDGIDNDGDGKTDEWYRMYLSDSVNSCTETTEAVADARGWNLVPWLLEEIPDYETSHNENITINLNDYFTDDSKIDVFGVYDDSEAQNLTVTFDYDIVTIDADDGFEGIQNITFNASDGYSSNQSNEIQITVTNTAPELWANITLQPGPDEINDTQIRDSDPDTNYGTGSTLFVGDGGGSVQTRSLILFLLENTTIPSNANVLDSQLKLYIKSFSGDGTDPPYIRAFRTNVSWRENETTWKNRTSTLAWSVPGLDKGVDIGSSLLSRYDIPSQPGGAETDYWINLTVTETLEGWVNGTYDNYGLFLNRSFAGGDDTVRLYSSDSGETSKRPKLEIIMGGIPYQEWLKSQNKTINLTKYFRDLDNENLIFSNKTSPENITFHFNQTTGIVTLDPDDDFFGTQNVTFTATDSGGKSVDSNNVYLTVYETDAEPPVTEIIPNLEGKPCFDSGYANITFNVTDDSSGVNKTTYCYYDKLKEEPCTPNIVNYTTTATNNTQFNINITCSYDYCPYQIIYYSHDNQGNKESTSYSEDIYIGNNGVCINDSDLINCTIIPNSTLINIQCQDSTIENSDKSDSFIYASVNNNSFVSGTYETFATIDDCYVSASTLDNSTLSKEDIYTRNCVAIDSTIEDSTLTNAQVYNSWIDPSTIIESIIINSTITDSTVKYSEVENTNFCGEFEVTSAGIIEGSLISGQIKYENYTYYAPFKLSDICAGVLPVPVGELTIIPNITQNYTLVTLYYHGQQTGYDVTVDASSLGSSSNIILEDGGEYPDEVIGDAIYSQDFTVISDDKIETLFAEIDDNRGNVFNVSANLTIDNTAPNASIVINNNETYATKREVQLNLEYNDTYGVDECRYANENLTALNNAEWEDCIQTKFWRLNNATEGTKTVFYQVKDNAGNNVTKNDTIILDLTPPVIEITYPLAGQIVSGDVNITFTGVVSNGEISVDGGSWISTDEITYHNWSTSSLENGAHTIQVRGYDAAGSWGYSNQVLVYVDNEIPFGYLSANNTVVKDGDTVLFSYNADQTGYTVFLNTTPLNSSGINLIDPDNDGIYEGVMVVNNNSASWTGQLTANVTDLQGNSFFPNVTMTLDNTFPTGSILINDGDTYTIDRNVMLILTFSDNVEVDECRYYETSWTNWEECRSTREWRVSDTDGNKTILYEIKDIAGNIQQYNDSINLTENAPLVNITWPLAGQTVSGVINITYTSSINNSIEISIDGSEWTLTDTNFTQEWNTTLESNGEHNIKIRDTDNAGNIGQDEINVFVDNEAPVGALTANNTIVKDGDTILFTYVGDEIGYTVNLLPSFLNISTLSFLDTNGNAVYNTILTVNNATATSGYEGQVIANITDNQGNNLQSDTSIILDNVQPAGTIEINNGATITYSNQVTLTLTYSDANGVDECRYNETGWTEWESCTSTKSWVLSSGEGNKTIWYEIKDNAGNVYQTNATINYTAHEFSPTMPTVVDEGDYTNSNNSLYAYWYGSESPYSIKYRYAVYNETDGDYLTGWTNTSETEANITGLNLVEGKNYTIRVVAFTDDGAESSESSSDGIVVDLTEPVMDYLNSTTHPNNLVFYLDNDPVFIFNSTDPLGGGVASGIAGYSYHIDPYYGTISDKVAESSNQILKTSKNTDQTHPIKESGAGSAYSVFKEINHSISTGEELEVSVSLYETTEDSTEQMNFRIYAINTTPSQYNETANAITDVKLLTKDVPYFVNPYNAETYKTTLTVTGNEDENFYIVVEGISTDNPTNGLNIAGSDYDIDENQKSYICEDGVGCTENTTTFDFAIKVEKTFSNNTWAKQYNNLADGVYWFHVRPFDYAGNWGEQERFQITIDSEGAGIRLYQATSPTYQNKTDITGYVGETANITLILNDAEVDTQTNVQGQFTFENVSLVLGMNLIKANASRGGTNVTSNTVPVLRKQGGDYNLTITYSGTQDGSDTHLVYAEESSYKIGFATESQTPDLSTSGSLSILNNNPEQDSVYIFLTPSSNDPTQREDELADYEFLELKNPLFYTEDYDKSEDYKISTVLSYEIIFLSGDDKVGTGNYVLIIENQGTESGRVKIGLEVR